MSSFWVQFFKDAGIPSATVKSYAGIFEENRITKDMLLDLNKEILLDMGIKVMGDLISILKHAKKVYNQELKRKEKFGPTNTDTNPTVAQIPAVSTTMSGQASDHEPLGDSSLDLNASDAWSRETAAQGVLPPTSPGYEGLDEAVQGVGDIERYHPVVHTTIRHGTLRSDQILLANKQLGSHHDVPVQTQDVAPPRNRYQEEYTTAAYESRIHRKRSSMYADEIEVSRSDEDVRPAKQTRQVARSDEDVRPAKQARQVARSDEDVRPIKQTRQVARSDEDVRPTKQTRQVARSDVEVRPAKQTRQVVMPGRGSGSPGVAQQRTGTLFSQRVLEAAGLHSRGGLDASRVVQNSQQSVFQRLDRSGKDSLQHRDEGKVTRDITVEAKRMKVQQQPDARSRLVVVKSSKPSRLISSAPPRESSMVADKMEQKGKTAVHLRVDRTRLGSRKDGSF